MPNPPPFLSGIIRVYAEPIAYYALIGCVGGVVLINCLDGFAHAQTPELFLVFFGIRFHMISLSLLGCFAPPFSIRFRYLHSVFDFSMDLGAQLGCILVSFQQFCFCLGDDFVVYLVYDVQIVVVKQCSKTMSHTLRIFFRSSVLGMIFKGNCHDLVQALNKS